MQCVTVVTFIVTSDDVTVVTFSNVTTVTFAAHNERKPNYVFIHIHTYIPHTLNILAPPFVVYGCWGRNTNFKVYTGSLHSSTTKGHQRQKHVRSSLIVVKNTTDRNYVMFPYLGTCHWHHTKYISTEQTPLWCRWMLWKVVKTSKNGSLYLKPQRTPTT